MKYQTVAHAMDGFCISKLAFKFYGACGFTAAHHRGVIVLIFVKLIFLSELVSR